jgi:hypothetical protein
MRTIQVEVTGISPLLMHRFGEDARNQVESKTSTALPDSDSARAAEAAAYRLPSGNLFLPAENLAAAMRRGASFHKIGRRSAVAAIRGGVFIRPPRIDMGTDRYEIDARSVVIRATKGRIMRCRPRLDQWKLAFEIEMMASSQPRLDQWKLAFEIDWDDAIIPNAELVRSVLADVGARVGIGDFRPERGGPFGRFVVTRWDH